MTFPQIPIPRMDSEEITINKIIKNEFENNSIEIRRSASRSRKKFKLDYKNIALNEFYILEDFINTYIGTIITFIHPTTQLSYQVHITTEELPLSYTTPKIVNTTIELEQV